MFSAVLLIAAVLGSVSLLATSLTFLIGYSEHTTCIIFFLGSYAPPVLGFTFNVLVSIMRFYSVRHSEKKPSKPSSEIRVFSLIALVTLAAVAYIVALIGVSEHFDEPFALAHEVRC